MTVPQTNFIWRTNETTGLTLTNYGTTSGNYTNGAAGSPVKGTDYDWFSGTGPLQGRFQNVTTGNTKMSWFSTAATAPGTTLTTINAFVAFNISDVEAILARTCFMRSDTANGRNGEVFFEAQNKVGSNFDLFAGYMTTEGGQLDTSAASSFSTLSFNTNYIVAISVDVTNDSAVVAQASLNGAAAVTLTGTTNWHGYTWGAAWPVLLRNHEYAIYGGLKGYFHGGAYQRGGTAWTGAELAQISSDPSAITGWLPAAPLRQTGNTTAERGMSTTVATVASYR